MVQINYFWIRLGKTNDKQLDKFLKMNHNATHSVGSLKKIKNEKWKNVELDHKPIEQ